MNLAFQPLHTFLLYQITVRQVTFSILLKWCGMFRQSVQTVHLRTSAADLPYEITIFLDSPHQLFFLHRNWYWDFPYWWGYTPATLSACDVAAIIFLALSFNLIHSPFEVLMGVRLIYIGIPLKPQRTVRNWLNVKKIRFYRPKLVFRD